MSHVIEKRASSLLIIVSLLEMLMGFAGSVLFLLSLDWSSLRSFYLIKTPIANVFTVGIDFSVLYIGMFYCLMTFPYVVLLVSGAGSLVHKEWARKINIVGVPLLTSAVCGALLYEFSFLRKIVNGRSFVLTIIPLCIFTVIEVWFFTRPAVRGIFKRRSYV